MSIKIAQIGCGYWGINLFRVFSQVGQVSHLIELDSSLEEKVKKINPKTAFTDNWKEVVQSPEVDAVVIATPAGSHYQLAWEALNQGKHVLVEKPLAMTTEQASQLIQLAESKNRVLMVGHTFLYNRAVLILRDLVQSGEIGKVYYAYSQRLNLGRVRQDVNAMWNLAPHDVSIMVFVLGQEPKFVSATGQSYLQPGLHDVVFMTLGFENGVMAHIHVSWLDPNKIRQMTVVGDRKMVVYNDMIESKIAIYDNGIQRRDPHAPLEGFDNFGAWQLSLRPGDIVLPKIDFKEPLQVEASHFLECIRRGQKPLTDGYNGLTVVKVLEAAQRSLEHGGGREEIR